MLLLLLLDCPVCTLTKPEEVLVLDKGLVLVGFFFLAPLVILGASCCVTLNLLTCILLQKRQETGSNGCEKWIPAYDLLRPTKLCWCLKLLISVVWLWCFSHSKYRLFWKWWTSLSQLQPGYSYSALHCWSGELSSVCRQTIAGSGQQSLK